MTAQMPAGAEPPARAAPEPGVHTGHRLGEMARESGWRAALSGLHELAGPRVLLAGPAGHVLAPTGTADAADRVRHGGVTRPRRPAEEKRYPPAVPGLVALRTAGAPDARDTTGGRAGADGAHDACGACGADVPDGADDADEQTRLWAVPLAELRLGLSQALSDQVLTHLGNRRTGDSTLLRQQLVQGAVADVVVEHVEIRCTLDTAGGGTLPWPAAVDVHRRLTGTGRTLLRLFGASGYTEDGPGRTVHVSELLTDAYVGAAAGVVSIP